MLSARSALQAPTGAALLPQARQPLALRAQRPAAPASQISSAQQQLGVPQQPQAHQQQRRRAVVGARQQRRRAATTMSADGGQPKKIRTLFVCLGNICRSPSAEAVFKSVVERAGVADQFEIDSCGTGGGSSNWYRAGGFSYHEGDPADSRMTSTAAARGVTLTSRSRPLTPADLAEFDYIIGMDAANIAAIKRAAVPADYASKVSLMTDYLTSPQFKSFTEVPDPYYGGSKGFELVLDLLDDACEGLLQDIKQRRRQ